MLETKHSVNDVSKDLKIKQEIYISKTKVKKFFKVTVLRGKCLENFSEKVCSAAYLLNKNYYFGVKILLILRNSKGN